MERMHLFVCFGICYIWYDILSGLHSPSVTTHTVDIYGTQHDEYHASLGAMRPFSMNTVLIFYISTTLKSTQTQVPSEMKSHSLFEEEFAMLFPIIPLQNSKSNMHAAIIFICLKVHKDIKWANKDICTGQVWTLTAVFVIRLWFCFWLPHTQEPQGALCVDYTLKDTPKRAQPLRRPIESRVTKVPAETTSHVKCETSRQHGFKISETYISKNGNI